MAINHAQIIHALREAVNKWGKEFPTAFLAAFGVSRATLRLIESRNLARGPNEIALSGKIWLRMAKSGDDLAAALSEIRESAEFARARARFAVVCDGAHLLAWDDKFSTTLAIPFAELPENYDFFLPLGGLYEKPAIFEEHPADARACEKMGELYDGILRRNPRMGKHELNVFLTRLLFCFFAEDTGIFPGAKLLTEAIARHTQTDGSNLAAFFDQLFAALDLPEDSPQRAGLPAWLMAFPYVNGALFAEKCPAPRFDYRMRYLLLQCGQMKWAEISPAIFGSMFQAVMDVEKRRGLGAHYTSEENILKVAGPLFLDDLKEEFQVIKNRKSGRKAALKEYLRKLSSLGFLDPACGCGNFLVVAYREIRELEIATLVELSSSGDQAGIGLSFNDVGSLSGISLSRFHGIEIEDFPAQIARVSLWLMEFMMNLKLGETFGRVVSSIPLKTAARIERADALELDWTSAVPPESISYILGNPPFGGSSTIKKAQKEQMRRIFGARGGKLDYVAAWIEKAAAFMAANPRAECAFVATNSICQGEQAAPLWEKLLNDGLHINFAWQTFRWSNEARGNAAVNCVILGFARRPRARKSLFLPSGPGGEIVRQSCSQINPYLVAAPTIIVRAERDALSAPLPMLRGNSPTDGGHLIIEAKDYEKFLREAPKAAPYVKKLIGSEEFLHKKPRWCLWLVDAPPEILALPEVARRIEAVKKFRLQSPKAATRRDAATPHLFQEVRFREIPENLLVIPRHTSERREYIPMGFGDNETIVGDSCHTVPNAGLYEFAILTSAMHQAWMRRVCGRLEMRYRYSRDLCYNTFPWPRANAAQKESLAALAQRALEAREERPDLALAQMYDPEKMPPNLREAHQELDLAVDALYRKKALASEAERLALLFGLYEKLRAGKGERRVKR